MGFIRLPGSAENLATELLEKSKDLSGGLQWRNFITCIWILGVIFCLLYFLITGIKEFRELKQCVPGGNETAERMIKKQGLGRKVSLYQGKAFSAPITYGVLHPKIVLPENLEFISRMDMRNMIAHELVHIQRHDVAKRFLLTAVLCIHWFNPFLWIMYRCYREDQEMSCDECVLKEMEQGQAKNYIYTMIKMTSERRSLLTTSEFWGKNAGKKRIIEAMSMKRSGKRNIFAAATFGVCFGISLVTVNPRAGSAEMEAPVEEAALEPLESTPGGREKISRILPVFDTRDYKLQVEDDYDYFAEIRDLEENYNDFSQEPTKEQAYAAQIKGYTLLAETYKERMEQGYEMSPEALWIIDEFYKYVEETEE